MRISVRKSDPGYHPMAGSNFRIMLDGEDVTSMCHTADETEGRVYGYSMNEQGHKYVDPITDLPAEHIMYGSVVIVELMNGARAHAEPC